MNFPYAKMFYICTKYKKNNHIIFKFVMKNRKLMLFFLLLVAVGWRAQRHELGVRAGISHLVGDVGRTDYLFQVPILKDKGLGVPLYGGIVYRRNLNPYQSLRVNLGYSSVQFDDAYSKEQYRRNRKLRGSNSGFEADVLFEYNFYPVNNEHKGMLSPYIFGGVGLMVYGARTLTFKNDFARNPATGQILPVKEDGLYDFTTTPTLSGVENKMIMSVPFGAGLKLKFNYNWVLSGEFTFKPTFSDGLDYGTVDNRDVRFIYSKDVVQPGTNHSVLQQQPYTVQAKERVEKYLKDKNIGNSNSKDWINSVTLTVTYSFGKPPCYCN